MKLLSTLVTMTALFAPLTTKGANSYDLEACEALVKFVRPSAPSDSNSFRRENLKSSLGDFSLFGSTQRIRVAFPQVTKSAAFERVLYTIMSSMGEVTEAKLDDGTISIITHFITAPKDIEIVNDDIEKLVSMIEKLSRVIHKRPHIDIDQLDAFHDRHFSKYPSFRFKKAWDEAMDYLRPKISPLMTMIIHDPLILEESQLPKDSLQALTLQVAYSMSSKEVFQLYGQVQSRLIEVINAHIDRRHTMPSNPVPEPNVDSSFLTAPAPLPEPSLVTATIDREEMQNNTPLWGQAGFGFSNDAFDEIIGSSSARDLTEYLDMKSANLSETSIFDLLTLKPWVAEKLERSGIHTLEDLTLTNAAELYFVHSRRTLTRDDLINIMKTMEDYGLKLWVPKSFGRAMNFYRNRRFIKQDAEEKERLKNRSRPE